MAPTIDFFVANLKCEHCGAVSLADPSTNIQTKIGKSPWMIDYKVGDFIDIDYDIEGAGFICLNLPENPRKFSMLDSWSCPSCTTGFNWVLICIDDGIISSIESARLNEDISAQINYVTEDIDFGGWVVAHGRLVDTQGGKA